jgi:hypothetical protein
MEQLWTASIEVFILEKPEIVESVESEHDPCLDGGSGLIFVAR